MAGEAWDPRRAPVELGETVAGVRLAFEIAPGAASVTARSRSVFKLAWYRKSADQGVEVAATNLGPPLMVGNTFGIPTDLPAARALFTRAAPPFAPAKRELGLLKQRGWGEPEDPADGLRLIREAAEHGHASAQRLVEEAYDRGLAVVSTDPREAVSWLQKAAAQGEAVAERDLGLHLKTGNGIPVDPQGALEWFRKAAYKGDGPAKSEVNSVTPNL